MTQHNQKKHLNFKIEEIKDAQLEAISGGILPGGCYYSLPIKIKLKPKDNTQGGLIDSYL